MPPHDSRRIGRSATPRSFLRDEGGFTLLELLYTMAILAILVVPISGLLLTSLHTSGQARERSAADALAQAQVESVRALPYTQVGVSGGNPSGALARRAAKTLPSGEAVNVAVSVGFVNDPVPTAYVTDADYKRIVVTVTRASDGVQLAQKTTYVSAGSAPPFSGTTWVQIRRQVVDAVTTRPLPGATVALSGGPSGTTRSDTTDGAGGVLFPALDSSSANPPPAYLLATTLTGYAVFPDDLPPSLPESIPASPGLVSSGTIRMYLPVSLTVSVLASTGAPYTGGATVSVDSSRCGVATVSIPAGQSSTTVTSCQYTSGKTVPLVPTVLGQVPSFDGYAASAWTAAGLWGGSAPVTVPAAYPTNLAQSVAVTLSAAPYATKQVKVTVTRGGRADTNARVEISGGPAGVHLFATTDATGAATLAVPVTAAASTYTAAANDMGAASGTATFSASTGSSSPIPVTMAIS